MRAVARATTAMATPARISRHASTAILHHNAAATAAITCLCRTRVAAVRRALSTDAASNASAAVAAATSQTSAPPAAATATAASAVGGGAERGPRSGSSMTERKKSKSGAGAVASSGNWSPIKGTHDYLPGWSSRQRALEALLAGAAGQYAYGEVRTPVVERADLFARSLGADSDVVSKEMFLFDDHGTNTVLRPENTASVARALLNGGLVSATSAVQRYWYSGPMFRRERPQAGRYRQFLQFGVELVGSDAVAADAEVIQLAAQSLRRLGLLQYVRLELNTLGDPESRAAYVAALTTFLQAHVGALSPDSQQRLARGSVLRILDSKEEQDQALLRGEGATAASGPAPLLSQFLSPASAARFAALQQALRDAGVAFTLNPFLVRGLDYYSHACFEFAIDLPRVRERVRALGKKGAAAAIPAQSTVLAGGRYDGLFPTLGGPNVPAIGWAAGLDRLLLLADLVEPDRRVTLPLPTPVGVVLIPDPLPAAGTAAAAAAVPVPAPALAPDSAAADDVSLAQAYSSLCTYIRDGCRLPAAAAAAAASEWPASARSDMGEGGYCVVQSFHASMSKQMKYCTRTLDDRAAHEQVALVLLLGSAEQAQQAVVAKNLADASQTLVPLADLGTFLRKHARRGSNGGSDGNGDGDSASALQRAPPAAQPLTFRMLRDAHRQ